VQGFSGDFDFVGVGRIVNGLRIEDRIKDDGRSRTRVSCKNVLIPAHPELLLTVPEQAPPDDQVTMLIVIATTIWQIVVATYAMDLGKSFLVRRW
jgi:hypothetical protein